MITKLSDEEIIKGFVNDYSKIKDEFKEVLKNNGFYWNRVREKFNQFGREGEWINPISKLSVRIRWGVVTPRAIVYVEKEFIDDVKRFFDSCKIVNGMKYPNQDYATLNLKKLVAKSTDEIMM